MRRAAVLAAVVIVALLAACSPGHRVDLGDGSSGNLVAAIAGEPDQLDPQKYYEYISEAVQPTSYLKSPYYTPLGFPEGMYRVGPLARLNVAEQMGTPKADTELKKFKKLGRGAVSSSFLYHYARLIEILAA